LPEISLKEIEALSYKELQSDTIFTYIALNKNIPVGSCTLTLTEDFRPDLGPWIADLVVAPEYQKQGIGKKLLHIATKKAKELGFTKLYLFTFDGNITNYYLNLNWRIIGTDQFKNHPVTIMQLILDEKI